MLCSPLTRGIICLKTLPVKEVCVSGRNMLGQVFYFFFLTHSNHKSVNFGSSYSHLVTNYGKHLPLPVKSRGKVLSAYNANICGTL